MKPSLSSNPIIDEARARLRKAIRAHDTAQTTLTQATAAVRRSKTAVTTKALADARELHLSAGLALDQASSRLAALLATQRVAHTVPQLRANLCDLASLGLIAGRAKAFGAATDLSNALRNSPLDLLEIDAIDPKAVASAREQVERFIQRLRRDPTANL